MVENKYAHYGRDFTPVEGDQGEQLFYILESMLAFSGEHDQLLSKEKNIQVLQPEHAWVITQYEMDILAPFLDTQVFYIETELNDAHRFMVTRRFDISQAQALKMVVNIQYASINLETRKMARLDVEDLLASGLVNQQDKKTFAKWQRPADLEAVQIEPITIESAYIDGNQHANNLVYLKLCYDYLPEDLKGQYGCSKINVKYGQELRLGEQVELVTYHEPMKDGEMISYHQFVKSDHTVACDLRLYWHSLEER